MIRFWIFIKYGNRWSRAHNFAGEPLEFTDLDACLQAAGNHLRLTAARDIRIKRIEIPEAEE